MGLWIYLFNRQEWEHLHRPCWNDSARWDEVVVPNVAVGTLYLTLGILFQITYIPLICVMLKPDFIKHSCYKFMIQLAIIDMIVLPCNSMITGIQAITGAHFCTSPGFYYVVGAIATSGWYGAAVTCILLALNRLFEMCWPELAKKLFHGKRIFIWLAISPFYALWTFTQQPGLYNNKHYAFFFDPFYSSGYEGMMEFTELTFHCIHNISTIVLLILIYFTLIIILTFQYKNIAQHTVSRLQKLLTLQSICICLEILVAASIYVFMQFVPVPTFILIVAHSGWIMVHGDTPLVYLILNKSLRTAFFQMLYRIFKKPTNAVSSMICKSSCTAEVNPEPQISTIQANRHSTSDQQPNVFL